MPDYGPPTPPPPSDTVTLGGGAWDDPKGPGRNRTWWYVGAGAVATVALVAGGAVFAATHIGGQRDPGPAAGLPSDTLAYAAIDLDPSAGQKIEALRALRRFPGFSHGVKIDPTSDLRRLMIEDELKTDGCTLDWSKDVEPWLGNDLGGAVVPTSSQGPQPVAILAVTDDAAAKRNLPKLLACGDDTRDDSTSGDHEPYGLAVSGGWAVIAKSSSIAQGVVSGAKGGSLADDTDFKTWTGRTGEAGVATFYASPDAGKTLAASLDKLGTGWFSYGPVGKSSSSGSGTAGTAPAAYVHRSGSSAGDHPIDPLSGLLGICPQALDGGRSGGPGDLGPQLQLEKQQLAALQGAAGTLRFAHGGFELESASAQSGAKPSSGAADLGSLPADTAFAFGTGGAGQSISQMVDGFTQGFTQECGGTADQLLQEITRLTGLTLPADLQTLFGNGFTFAVSGAIDPEELTNSTDPSSLPAGIRLKGDPDQVAGVLKKVTVPGASTVLQTTAGDGVVAVGPDADYRAQLAKGDGGLGRSKAFTDVVPHADQASTAMFLSFDAVSKILASDAVGAPADVRDNLSHLSALGASSWFEGGIRHGLVRVSTK